MGEFSMQPEDSIFSELELESFSSEEFMGDVASEFSIDSIDYEDTAWSEIEAEMRSLELEEEEEDKETHIHHKSHLTNSLFVIPISRDIILKEIVEHLEGKGPMYEIIEDFIGFRGYAKVQVHRSKENKDYYDIYACSEGFCRTKCEAKEKASEWLIRHLQTTFNFQINEMNWFGIEEQAEENGDILAAQATT